MAIHGAGFPIYTRFCFPYTLFVHYGRRLAFSVEFVSKRMGSEIRRIYSDIGICLEFYQGYTTMCAEFSHWQEYIEVL